MKRKQDDAQEKKEKKRKKDSKVSRYKNKANGKAKGRDSKLGGRTGTKLHFNFVEDTN